MDDSATSVTSSVWASLNSWFTSTVLFVLLNLMIATIVFTSNLPTNNHQQQQEEERKQDSRTHRNQPLIARSPSILHRLRSFNFYPQKSQHELSPETHYHQQPLEVAATQYVFNQPLDYQHFGLDSMDSVNHFSSPNRVHEARLADSETRVENVTAHYDFDHTRREDGVDTAFGLDPTRQESSGDVGFDFELTRLDMDTYAGFGFDTVDEEHTDEFQSLDEVYSMLKRGGHDRAKSDGNIQPKPPAKMKKSASLKLRYSHLEEEEIVEARRPSTVKEKKSAVRMGDDDDVEVDSRADDFINKFRNDLKLQRIESIIRTTGATNRGTAK